MHVILFVIVHVILFVAVIFILKPFINRKTVSILILVVILLVIRESISLERIYQFELNEKEKTYSIYFYRGKSENVEIPSKYKKKKVTTIGRYAFFNETKRFVRIKKVKVPNTIKTIEEGAFYANRLEEIIIPDSVVFIDYEAFYLNRLKNIKIGSAVTRIGEDAFSENDLKKVIIPNSVKSIGKDAFAGNEGLIIYGSLGSEAERYAKSEGISFKELK